MTYAGGVQIPASLAHDAFTSNSSVAASTNHASYCAMDARSALRASAISAARSSLAARFMSCIASTAPLALASESLMDATMALDVVGVFTLYSRLGAFFLADLALSQWRALWPVSPHALHSTTAGLSFLVPFVADSDDVTEPAI
jgi:hypothetical protein